MNQHLPVTVLSGFLGAGKTTLLIDELMKHWQKPWGDRRQEIVLIGVEMDRAAQTKLLDACLLTDAEMARGEAEWANFKALRALEDNRRTRRRARGAQPQRATSSCKHTLSPNADL